MGLIKLISRESRRDERSSRRRRRKKIEKKFNGNINGCQSIPGAGASGEENKGERHVEKVREREKQIDVHI